jgi:hypothetical protein
MMNAKEVLASVHPIFRAEGTSIFGLIQLQKLIVVAVLLPVF